jgi:predicted nucleic acid-binding protein
MTNYLLDTCIISEFTRPKPNQKVLAWLNSVDADRLFLSAVTIGEIQRGIADLPPSNRRTLLEAWLQEDISDQYAGRILPLDHDTFITWGRMIAHLKSRGRPMSVMDSLIAATVSHHKMVLVTRNVSDFESADVSLFNPWE